VKRGGRLPRYTPMNRGNKPLKRCRLNQVSKTQRKRISEAKPVRDALKERYPWCWICGRTKNLTVHEIAKGSHRTKALDQLFALLVACWDCNSGPLEDPRRWPIAKQLACLMRVAPNNFDLAAFNALRGRAESAVTMPEIENHLPV
jgi:hypothetical protein